MKTKILFILTFFTLCVTFFLMTCGTKNKEEDDLKESKFLFQMDANIYSNDGVVYTFHRHPNKGILLENNKAFKALDSTTETKYYLEDINGKRFNFTSFDTFPWLTVIASLQNNIKIYKIIPPDTEELLFTE